MTNTVADENDVQNGGDSTLSIEVLLSRLRDEGELPRTQELIALSDLSLADMKHVQEAWSEISDSRRLYVVQTLVDESSTNLQIQLGRLLRLALTDALPEVRILAIRGLWEDREEDLVGPLIHALNNDLHEAVRAAAAEALGGFVLAGELDELSPALAMRAEDSLLAVLHAEMEPLAVQARALEGIAFSGENGIRDLIEDYYFSPYDEMREAALRAMGRSADVRWRSTVQAELASPDAETRAAAARACGELEARDALEDLIELLSDESKAVRLAAVFALGRVGGREAREMLGAMSESDDSDESQAAATSLEEALFYGDAEGIPLFDETPESWEDEPDDWEEW